MDPSGTGERPLARVLGPIRAMLTPALATLLTFQVLSGILVSPMFTLFPIYVEKELGFTLDFSGNIRAAFVVTGGVLALFGGALCDAVGRKPSYLLAMTGIIASGTLFLIRAPGWMYGIALYSGLMFGLGSVAGQSYVMDAAARGSLALATACYFLTGTLGNALGSAIAGRIANEAADGYRILGWGMVGGHALLLLAAWRLMPAIPRPAASRSTAAGGFRELFGRAEVWCLLGLRLFATVYWGAVTLLMPLLLFRLTGSEKPAGDYTSASLIVAAVCQLVMGRIVDRTGPRVPVMASISVVLLAALGQAVSAGSAAGLVAFGLLGAGAAWSLSITMTTLIQELSSETTRARLLGMTHMAWSAGFLGGTVMAGYLAREASRAPLALYVSAVCCALAVACAAAVVRAIAPTPGPSPGCSPAG